VFLIDVAAMPCVRRALEGARWLDRQVRAPHALQLLDSEVAALLDAAAAKLKLAGSETGRSGNGAESGCDATD